MGADEEQVGQPNSAQ
jgi:putative SOS response-associated peptidase YedK